MVNITKKVFFFYSKKSLYTNVFYLAKILLRQFQKDCFKNVEDIFLMKYSFFSIHMETIELSDFVPLYLKN